MGEAPPGQPQNYKKTTPRNRPDFPGISAAAEIRYGTISLEIKPSPNQNAASGAEYKPLKRPGFA
jgi:hypothetical protein